MASFVTNASASNGSGPEPRRRWLSKAGDGTSTRCGRIPALAISHLQPLPPTRYGQRPEMQRPGTLQYLGPSRPGPLRHRPVWGNSTQEPLSQVNRGPTKPDRSG